MKKLIILTLIVLIFNSCSEENDVIDDNSQNPEPVGEIADNVVIILEENSELLSTESELTQGTYKIQFDSTIPVVEIGDIILGDEGEGFLRRVSAIEINNQVVSYQTTQATLDDLFNDANFSFSTGISENRSSTNTTENSEIVLDNLHENVTMSEDGFSFDFSNTEIYNNGSASFKITDGNVTFTPNINFDSQFTILNGLQELDFNTNNTNLSINCDFDFNVTNSLPLPAFETNIVNYTRFFKITLGAAPIIIAANVRLDAKLSASVGNSLTLSSGFLNTYNLDAGIKYTNNDWDTSFDFSPNLTMNDINYDNVINFTQNFTIAPRVSIKVMGVVGPYLQPELFEELSFNYSSTSQNWDAKMDLGINYKIGVFAEIFGETIFDFDSDNPNSVTIWEAPDKIEKISGDLQIGQQGQILSEPIKVRVSDSSGQLYQKDVPVYFDVVSGGGTVNNLPVLTDENGYAEAFWTLGNNSDDQIILVKLKNADGSNNPLDEPLTFNANSDDTGSGEIEFTGTWSFSPNANMSLTCYDYDINGDIISSYPGPTLSHWDSITFNDDGETFIAFGGDNFTSTGFVETYEDDGNLYLGLEIYWLSNDQTNDQLFRFDGIITGNNSIEGYFDIVTAVYPDGIYGGISQECFATMLNITMTKD